MAKSEGLEYKDMCVEVDVQFSTVANCRNVLVCGTYDEIGDYNFPHKVEAGTLLLGLSMYEGGNMYVKSIGRAICTGEAVWDGVLWSGSAVNVSGVEV